MTLLDYPTFFSTACGSDRAPYGYQKRLACGERKEGQDESAWLSQSGPCESRLITIPTGLGKTAAVVLAWLWNRCGEVATTSVEAGPVSNPWPRRGGSRSKCHQVMASSLGGLGELDYSRRDGTSGSSFGFVLDSATSGYQIAQRERTTFIEGQTKALCVRKKTQS